MSLKILRNNSIHFDGEPASIPQEEMGSFLHANLSLRVEVEEGLKLSELIHFLYPLREFVKDYCVEDYEVVRAMVTINKLQTPCTYVKFFKNVSIEEEYLFFMPDVELGAEQSVTEKLSDLEVKIDEKIKIPTDEGGYLEFKNEFTLLNLLSSVFEELLNLIRNQ